MPSILICSNGLRHWMHIQNRWLRAVVDRGDLSLVVALWESSLIHSTKIGK